MSTNTNRVNNPMKVITGPDTRWSYANVWEPKSINGGTPKYSVSLIIPKSDTRTVAKIKAAIEAAYQEGQAKLKGNGRSVPPLSAIKTPLRDGDVERPDDPAYANAYFINANSATAPGIVDADRNPVLTRSEVYSGVYGRASINGGTPKYSVSLIIPKSDTRTVAKIKAAIEAAYQEGQAKLKGNGRSVPPLSAIKTPLRDGDVERPDDPAYANAYFINANSATAPGIVDADRNPVLTRSEVYSGVYGRASINLYAFNSNGNKGIACGLNNLQLIRPGEPLGGKASAEADFATDDDEDFLG